MVKRHEASKHVIGCMICMIGRPSYGHPLVLKTCDFELGKARQSNFMLLSVTPTGCQREETLSLNWSELGIHAAEKKLTCNMWWRWKSHDGFRGGIVADELLQILMIRVWLCGSIHGVYHIGMVWLVLKTIRAFDISSSAPSNLNPYSCIVIHVGRLMKICHPLWIGHSWVREPPNPESEWKAVLFIAFP